MTRIGFRLALAGAVTIAASVATTGTGTAAQESAEAAAACAAVLQPITGGAAASSEPLAACQWDMITINATTDGAHTLATGAGVTVGVIDSGVDIDHPDIAPNLDLARSCSFIFDHDPAAAPIEMANGDCTNKAALVDLGSHGTHVASTIAAPVNGIGIAGVAPDATIVAIKACGVLGYCFADSVAAAIRYAGDLRLDVINLSLFADPYLYYCGNDAAQRAQYQELKNAAKYAQQRGVAIVAAAGNEASDLQHPTVDTISPDWPDGAAVERIVHNNCRQAPTELPGVLAVSSVGPLGIAGYSNVGKSAVDVAAPGGDLYDWYQDALVPQHSIMAAASGEDDPVDGIYSLYDFYDQFYPGLTVIDHGARYMAIDGTSMAAPHAAGVAALVVEQHPNWSPSAVLAAVRASTQATPCPGPNEPNMGIPCQGKNGRTSYFGTGIVDALAAAKR
jgi:subtilisin family serine protease